MELALRLSNLADPDVTLVRTRPLSPRSRPDCQVGTPYFLRKISESHPICRLYLFSAIRSLYWRVSTPALFNVITQSSRYLLSIYLLR